MKRWHVVVLLLLVILFYVLATGFAMYFRLLYGIGLAFALSYLWSLLGIRGIEVEAQRRSLRLQVGDTVEELITVRNTSSIPKPWLEVRDLTTLPGPALGRVVRVGGRDSRTWVQRITPHRRGVYTLGPLEVQSRDLFGLFVHRRYLLGTHNMVVYPATQEIPVLRLPLVGQTGEGSRQQHALLPTPHASTVREYLPSDGFSRIHWPSTAHTGKLMVKQFDQGVGNSLWLLVDLHREAQAGTDPDVTDEYAVMVAASVAKRYLDLRVPVGLIGYGDEVVSVPADKGMEQLPRVLGALARVRAEGEVPLSEVLLRRQVGFRGLNTLMVITSSTDPLWAATLPPIMQQGTRVVAVLVDPASFGAASSLGPVLDRLMVSGVTSYVVRRGEPLMQGLARPYQAGGPVSAANLEVESTA